jgi:hypothetical protein
VNLLILNGLNGSVIGTTPQGKEDVMTNKFDYHTTNLAIFAVRYAMGKSTPAAWQVIEAMKAKWAEIDPSTQAQIVKEIVKDLPTAIIADNVHAEWMGFLEWVAKS